MFQIARLKNHPDTYTAEGRAADKLFSPFSKQYPYHYYKNSRKKNSLPSALHIKQ